MGQPITWPVGYCTLNPSSDPLPPAGTTMCPPHTASMSDPCLIAAIAGTKRPCLFQSNDSTGATFAGVPVRVSGMTPDADVLYIDAKIDYSFDGTISQATSEINGAPTGGKLEWNIIDCHIRGGARCTQPQIAQLNAQRTQGTLSGGNYRSHYQPSYYTCPLFNADVPDSLTTLDPLDGGANLDLGTMSLSFSLIEQDLERMGCATCHDRFNGPGQLHLVYKPWSPDLMRLNWQNLLPWTSSSTAGGLPGGRFVNGPAPVPQAMKDRWLSWISAGAPY